MGLFNKMKDKLGLNDDYDEDMYGADNFAPAEERTMKQEQSRAAIQSETVKEGKNINFSSALSSLRNGHGAAANNPALKMVVVEPINFDDAQQIANCLKENRPVVINFETTEAEIANRIVDFISGTVYALSGEIKKISRNVFLCAPSNVSVSFKKERQQGGFTGDMPWAGK